MIRKTTELEKGNALPSIAEERQMSTLEQDIKEYGASRPICGPE
jgi:hypothetical protein